MKSNKAIKAAKVNRDIPRIVRYLIQASLSLVIATGVMFGVNYMVINFEGIDYPRMCAMVTSIIAVFIYVAITSRGATK